MPCPVHYSGSEKRSSAELAGIVGAAECVAPGGADDIAGTEIDKITSGRSICGFHVMSSKHSIKAGAGRSRENRSDDRNKSTVL
jgi:hypothetical protein